MKHAIIAKMKNTDRRIVCFYGSQTGTAEEYASRLSKEGQMYGMRGVVADPEENEIDSIFVETFIDKILIHDPLDREILGVCDEN